MDTFVETNLNSSVVSPGYATRKAEESKRRKYSALEARFRFEPIAVETTGVYSVTTTSVISELGRRITEVTGEPRKTFWLRQKMGLAIQRGNAFSILTAAARERGAIQATTYDHEALPHLCSL